jgi:hypothetical protein
MKGRKRWITGNGNGIELFVVVFLVITTSEK